MRQRLYLFWVALTLMILWGFPSVPLAWAETYHGKVVDAETGEPLEGAVVIVIWYTKPYISFDYHTYFHDVKETVTASKGEFSVDASPAIDWNPFTYVKDDPWIVVYKPGYSPLTPPYAALRGLKPLENALERGDTVRLIRLKPKQELSKDEIVEITGIGSIAPLVPAERVPNLMRLINVQRVALGFQPYPGSFGGGKKQ